MRQDTPRSWLVLAAACFCYAQTLGCALSLGTLYGIIANRVSGSHSNLHDESPFRNGTKPVVPDAGAGPRSDAAISFLLSLNVALTQMIGLVAIPLTGIIGYRATITIGAFLAALGFGLSALATHIWHLYLTLGLLTGFGFGLALTPAIGVLTYYFSQDLFPLASSFAMCGAPAGVLVYSFVHPALFTELSWESAMLIEAGLCAVILFLPLVLRPERFHTESNVVRPKPDENLNMSSTDKTILVPENSADQPLQQESSQKLSDLMHGYLFKDPIFYLLMIASQSLLASDIFIVITPQYLMATHGWSSTKSAASIVFIHGIAALMANAVMILLNSRPSWGNRVSIFGQTIVGILCKCAAAVAYLCVPVGMIAAVTPKGVANTQNQRFLLDEPHAWIFIIFSVVCAFGFTITNTYQAPLLNKMLPKNSLTATFGYLLCLCGILTLALFPLAGAVADWTGTFRYSYLICVVLCATGVLALIGVLWIKRRHGR